MKSKTLTTTNLNSGNREKFNCAIEINGIDIVPLSSKHFTSIGG